MACCDTPTECEHPNVEVEAGTKAECPDCHRRWRRR